MNPGVYGTSITSQDAHYGDVSDMPYPFVIEDAQPTETFSEIDTRVHREIAEEMESEE